MDWIANRDAIRWFLDEIWPKLHKAVPGFEFFFAGRNMPDSFMRDQPPGTHCMDEVASADDFIADKKILIVPLRSGGGIRVKILEAMASGKVIIATPVAIKGIEAKQGEHYMLVRRPHDFVKAINWCLENRDAAQEMADRARRLIREKYDHAGVIGSVVNELERLYNRRMM